MLTFVVDGGATTTVGMFSFGSRSVTEPCETFVSFVASMLFLVSGFLYVVAVNPGPD